MLSGLSNGVSAFWVFAVELAVFDQIAARALHKL